MIYLDNAATSFPKPPEVYDNTFRFMRESAGNPGRGVHHFSTASAQVIEDTRRAIAQLFAIPDSRRVIFAYNCTDGINIILKGLLQKDDHVIASNLDHNSVSRP
ncbi:MAG TPA: aminotransferase class V-fold PLP-dependent enzyme, partial [Acidobacteriota bacterium]